MNFQSFQSNENHLTRNSIFLSSFQQLLVMRETHSHLSSVSWKTPSEGEGMKMNLFSSTKYISSVHTWNSKGLPRGVIRLRWTVCRNILIPAACSPWGERIDKSNFLQKPGYWSMPERYKEESHSPGKGKSTGHLWRSHESMSAGKMG